MGPIGCPETSVTNYQSMLPDIQEEQRSLLDDIMALVPAAVHIWR